MEKILLNFKITRTIISTRRKVITGEVLAENEAQAKAIVAKQLADESSSIRFTGRDDCGSEDSRGQIISINETTSVDEIK